MLRTTRHYPRQAAANARQSLRRTTTMWLVKAARAATPQAKRWWSRGPSIAVLITVIVVVLIYAASLILIPSIWSGKNVPKAIEAIQTAVIAPLGIAGIAYVIFLIWRRNRVVGWYRKRCRTNPQARVPTAGSMTKEVIGREELCRMLMENLRQSPTPNIIVGGVGAGKTSVLVKLLEMLAQKGAVPVAVELREARDKLDFHQLGFEAFQRELSERAISAGDLERIWNQLRQAGRAVVLADGLEDALPEEAGESDRHNKIQIALQRAVDAKLPLIVTSRQHGPLRALDAPITALDPVGEGPALDYLTRSGRAPGRRELANLVQGADVADSPLFLQIIHDDLQTEGRLPQVAPEHQQLRQLTTDFAGKLREGRTVDRCGIRLRVLQCWEGLLIKGDLRGDYALPPERRKRTLAVLAALACIGLRDDHSEVRFADLIGSDPDAPRDRCADPQPPSRIALWLWDKLVALDECADRPVDPECERTLEQAVKDRRPFRDQAEEKKLYAKLQDECELAAQYGSNLGIVVQKGAAIRFHHTILQAYLGIVFLDEAMTDETYLEGALTRSGREFLLALVLLSRLKTTQPEEVDDLTIGLGRERHSERTRGSKPTSEFAVCVRFGETTEARRRDILTIPGGSLWHRRLWERVHTADRVTRLRILAAIAEIEAGPARVDAGRPVLWLVGRPIGRRSDGWDRLARDWEKRVFQQPDIQDRTLLEAKAHLLHRIGDTNRLRAEADGHSTNGAWFSYRDLFRIAVAEDDDSIQLIVTREIAHGRDPAFEQLREAELGGWWRWWNHYWHEWRPFFADDRDTADEEKPIQAMARQWRKGRVCALLAPMLFYHGDRDFEEQTAHRAWAKDASPRSAYENLRWWVTEFLAKEDPAHPAKRPWISLEIALARGFRHAANHRPTQTLDDSRRRAALGEQAEAALRHTRFWYAQLILIQALTLLEMPDEPGAPIQNRGHGSDPRRLTRHWVDIAGTGFAELRHREGPAKHPFVVETAALCERALLTRLPAQYCWTDEAGTVEKVGSLQRPGRLHEHELWILPSSGWGALTAEAQHLLGDIMLMLNLAERGQSPAEREERWSRADRADLPPCLTRDPSAMDVRRTIGSAMAHNPGSTCHDECPFRLCPYPPIGDQSFRFELPEGFCRQLTRSGTQGSYEEPALPGRHKRLWEELSWRARPGRTRDDR